MGILQKRPLATMIALFMIVLFVLSKVSIVFYIKLTFFILCSIVFIVFLFVFKKITIPGFLSLGVCLSLLVSFFYFDCYVNNQKTFYGTNESITCSIDKVTYKSDYATYCDISVEKIGDKKVSFKAKLESDFYLDVDKLDVVKLEASLSDFDDSLDDFDEKSYYNSKGYYLLCSATNNSYEVIGKNTKNLTHYCSDINDFCTKRLQKILDEDSIGICSAVLLGNKTFLSDNIKRDFSQIGISHMLAVSGLHLTVMVGGLYFVLKVLFVPKKARNIVSIIFCFAYMGLVGFVPSVVRAGIMYIFMSISQLIKKDSDSVTNLFVAGGIITLINPNAIIDPSFLLSFFATMGIVFSIPIVTKITERIKLKLLKNLLSSLLITFFAVLYTIPITSVYFGKIYPLVPISNLIISPFISIILFLSFLAIPISFVPLLSNIFASIINFLCSVIKSLIDFFVNLHVKSIIISYPFAKYIIIAVSVMLVVLLLLKIKRSVLFFIPILLGIIAYIICLAIFISSQKAVTNITFYNNNKNDMIMLNENGNTYIIDISTGGKKGISTMISLAKKNYYEENIDGYIITHYHSYLLNTINKITDSNYILSIYLPKPLTEQDKKYYYEICDLLSSKGVVFIEYEDTIEINNLYKVNLFSLNNGRNIHNIHKLELQTTNRNIAYYGSSWGDCFEPYKEYDVIFFGAHGPKQKQIYSDTCILSVFANNSLIEQNSIISKEFYNLEDSNGVISIKYKT